MSLTFQTSTLELDAWAWDRVLWPQRPEPIDPFRTHKGVKIEIELYQALSFSDVAALDTNFKKLVKYSTIPVIYNGKEIQKSPEKVEWDSQTDDACLFCFNDLPVMEKLALFREEALTDGGGHQSVTSQG